MHTLNSTTSSEHSRSTTFVFRLYVAGEAPNSILALRNLKTVCEAHYMDNYKIDIVDVLLSPESAWAAGVIVTPLLERLSPEPLVQIIGNLSNTDQLATILGLSV